MQFIFAYLRQAQAEPERDAPRAILLGIGMLVVLLVIFLSFENADGATLTSHLSLGAPCGSMEASAADGAWEMDLEQNSWRSEVKNSPPERWDLQSQ